MSTSTVEAEHANGAAIVVAEERAIARPVTHRGIITAEALREEAEQRKLLGQYVRDHMIAGTDYGVIPGTQKPTLLKPGAEKLTELFRCVAQYRVAKRVEDWDRGLFHYELKCSIRLRGADMVIAEGVGSCNSREGRYRWRDANRKCPSCGKESIFASKHDPGFFCWAKRGGCGATFGPSDTSITSQTQGKVENEDVFTLVNTILKMAKKRALVDAALALGRCSDLFTQDVEDIAEERSEAPAPVAKTHSIAAARAKVKAAAEVLGGEVVEPGVFVFPFGKHKGKSVTEAPRDYIEWLLGNSREQLDAGTAKNPAQSKALIATLDAELARRGDSDDAGAP